MLENEMDFYIDEANRLTVEVKHLEEELRVSREAHADTMRQQADRILELEAEVKRWKDAYDSEFLLRMDLVLDKEDLKDKVKQLRKGIEKHKNHGYGNEDWWDEELYKLLEEK